MNEYPAPVSASTTPSKPPRKPRKPSSTKTIVAFVAIAFLGLGGGTGYALGYEASPEPEIITEKVEVEVEKIVEKEVDLCSGMLESAEDMRKKLVEGFEAAEGYPELVGDAYEAGAMGNDTMAQSVLDKMKELNDRLSVVGEELTPIMAAYNEDLVDCTLVG